MEHQNLSLSKPLSCNVQGLLLPHHFSDKQKTIELNIHMHVPCGGKDNVW